MQATDNIVERFQDEYPNGLDTRESDRFTVSGDGYGITNSGMGTIMLYCNLTSFGDNNVIPLTDDTLEPLTYRETQTIDTSMDSYRVYTFETSDGSTEHLDVDRVRPLASNVFNVEYDTFREWVIGRTDPSESPFEDAGCVVFDVPDSDWRAAITPIFVGD